ncbi:hypothetical protein LUZ61_020725 [Rhynchospora tenuis]|uniref:TOG domain-containing protein n=1 Tax=Rhynchospora tenuis TaxID=198213 RepID=A0AAD6EPB5_9POAL|nr:hypothetical protein LUZ61_020725 [Rhynchospora tenuis]
MDELLELARSGDPAGGAAVMHHIDQLLAKWHVSGRELSVDESTPLVELCTDLLKDADSSISRGALDALCFVMAFSTGADQKLMARLDGLTPMVLEKLGDENHHVREASRRFIVSLMEMKEKNARIEKEKQDANDLVQDLNLRHIVTTTREVKSSSINTKCSPKAKTSSPKKTSLISGQSENTNRVEVIKVSSDKELVREIERIAFNLLPDKEWSIRMAAMQRLEGIVLGGGTHYKSFPGLLKHLVTPFITQLLDRRSSVVKQVCHLLCLLSKETLRDFEACAELLIPVLFKLVVITIQVIAESADNCIKTILCNCKVTRLVSRIIDCAKNDRSAVLRARCCEYALLMLECWVDSPEIQKSADLYEDLIKCCIEDATSEVRSTARSCYRLFTKTWPDRSLRLFESFDPARQKVLNDEEGDLQKKPIPSLDEPFQLGTQISNSYSNGAENHDIALGEEKCEVINDEESDFNEKSVTDNHDIVGVENCEVIISREDSYFSEKNLSLTETKMEEEKEKEEEELAEGDDQQQQKENREFIPLQMQDLPAPCSENPHLGFDPQSQPPADTILSPQNAAIYDKTIVTIGQQKLTDSPSSNPTRTESKHNSKSSDETRTESKPNSKSSDETRTNYIPNFQRPLLRKQMTNWFLAKDKNENTENNPTQVKLGEMPGYADVPSSLAEALTEGLNPKSDWIMRVFVFNFLKSLLNHGPKGLQEVLQNFDKVMKLFFLHLDDPHYKVAHASLTTLEEIIPKFKKQAEHYLDRILPRVFSRLHDPKESIRKNASDILQIISENYGVDSILPGLLRSLDEQKAPRARLAIIEYARENFEKYTANADFSNNNSFIKLWLGKLVPLFKDKNTRLKEAALAGILIIYTNFDPGSVLGFLTGLSVEQQKPLRLALKQRNPRIEVDLVNFMQAKKQRPRYAPSLDRYGVIEPAFSSYPTFKFRSMDCGSKSSFHMSDNSEGLKGRFQKLSSAVNPMPQKSGCAVSSYQSDEETSINQILNQVCNGNSRSSSLTKQEAMHQFVEISKHRGNSVWFKHLHQFSIALLEMIDDTDPSVRELSLSLLVEMLDKQRESMEEHLEVLIMKLLHATKDSDMNIVNQAQRCLNITISQYEPLRCLAAIRPLLVCEDEKLLIVCANCLAKIIGRFSEEDLMAQLLSFVPSLLDLIGNRSPYVRKTVLLCLVEIYLKLGKAFMPYLERLDAVHLRLVTTYASHFSQPELMTH